MNRARLPLFQNQTAGEKGSLSLFIAFGAVQRRVCHRLWSMLVALLVLGAISIDLPGFAGVDSSDCAEAAPCLVGESSETSAIIESVGSLFVFSPAPAPTMRGGPAQPPSLELAPLTPPPKSGV